MKPSKILTGLTSLALISLLISQPIGMTSCKEADKDSTKPTSGEPAPGAMAAFPDNSFHCLRAGADTVRQWLALNGTNDRHSRVVFKYFWANRAHNNFTVITELNQRANRMLFDLNTDTLSSAGLCQVNGIGNPLVLSNNQISIATIRRLWSFATDPSITYWLKFTPIIRPDPDGTGANCCVNHLVYRVDLMPTPGGSGSTYEAGYTNPSPPKQPED